MAWPEWEAGDLMTADDLNNRQSRTVYKTAFEQRASTTTLAADSELTIDVGLYIYVVKAWIFYSSTGTDTADLKVSWSAPTGASMWWANFGLDVNDATQSGSLNTHFNTTVSTSRIQGAVSEGPVGMFMRGILSNPTNVGTLNFLWAQGTSNATATTVRETSHITVEPIREL